MVGYRISKYDPQSRNPDGSFDQYEWTSYSDVGKLFAQKRLKLEDYLETESKYVNAILSFFAALDVTCLVIEEIEVPGDWQHIAEGFGFKLENLPPLENGSVIDQSQLPTVIRLALREILWAKLKGDCGAFLHFGYDYYAYIGADVKKISGWNLPNGIHAESYISPYFS